MEEIYKNLVTSAQKEKNVEVKKEDISLIGHTVYNDNGFTTFICSIDKAKIEYLLLRDILKCFGNEYCIITTGERFKDENDLSTVTDRVFVTNLPFSEYLPYEKFEIDFQ